MRDPDNPAGKAANLRGHAARWGRELRTMSRLQRAEALAHELSAAISGALAMAKILEAGAPKQTQAAPLCIEQQVAELRSRDVMMPKEIRRITRLLRRQVHRRDRLNKMMAKTADGAT